MAQPIHGLSEAEAREALLRVGPNESPRAATHSLFKIARETLRGPMLLLLLGAAGLYLFLGEIGEGLSCWLAR